MWAFSPNVWSFVFSVILIHWHTNFLAHLFKYPFWTACTTEHTRPTKPKPQPQPQPRSILRKQPRIDAPQKHVTLKLNDLQDKHWRRGKRAILKHTNAVNSQSRKDGKRNYNIVAHNNPNARFRQCKPPKEPLRDTLAFSWWSNGDNPSTLSPSHATDIPCDESNYPVSEASTSDDEVCNYTSIYYGPDGLDDPKDAYFWFRWVHMMITENLCSSYLLRTRCSPAFLVAMVQLGWISVQDVTAFAESRGMLSEGLYAVSKSYNARRYGKLLDRMRETGMPMHHELNRFYDMSEWRRDQIKEQIHYDYDVKKDDLDRSYNGPFGSLVARYGTPDYLEKTLYAMIYSLPGAAATFPELDALLAPLVHRLRTFEEILVSREPFVPTVVDTDIIMTDLTITPESEARRRMSIPSPLEPLRDQIREEQSGGKTRSRTCDNQRFNPYRPALKKHLQRRHACANGPY